MTWNELLVELKVWWLRRGRPPLDWTEPKSPPLSLLHTETQELSFRLYPTGDGLNRPHVELFWNAIRCNFGDECALQRRSFNSVRRAKCEAELIRLGLA